MARVLEQRGVAGMGLDRTIVYCQDSAGGGHWCGHTYTVFWLVVGARVLTIGFAIIEAITQCL